MGLIITCSKAEERSSGSISSRHRMRRYRHRKKLMSGDGQQYSHVAGKRVWSVFEIQSNLRSRPNQPWSSSFPSKPLFIYEPQSPEFFEKKNLERLYIWSSPDTGWSHGCSQLSSTSCLCSTLNPTKQDTLIVCSIHVYRIETPSLGRHGATQISALACFWCCPVISLRSFPMANRYINYNQIGPGMLI